MNYDPNFNQQMLLMQQMNQYGYGGYPNMMNPGNILLLKLDMSMYPNMGGFNVPMMDPNTGMLFNPGQVDNSTIDPNNVNLNNNMNNNMNNMGYFGVPSYNNNQNPNLTNNK